MVKPSPGCKACIWSGKLERALWSPCWGYLSGGSWNWQVPRGLPTSFAPVEKEPLKSRLPPRLSYMELMSLTPMEWTASRTLTDKEGLILSMAGSTSDTSGTHVGVRQTGVLLQFNPLDRWVTWSSKSLTSISDGKIWRRIALQKIDDMHETPSSVPVTL